MQEKKNYCNPKEITIYNCLFYDGNSECKFYQEEEANRKKVCAWGGHYQCFCEEAFNKIGEEKNFCKKGESVHPCDCSGISSYNCKFYEKFVRNTLEECYWYGENANCRCNEALLEVKGITKEQQEIDEALLHLNADLMKKIAKNFANAENNVASYRVALIDISSAILSSANQGLKTCDIHYGNAVINIEKIMETLKEMGFKTTFAFRDYINGKFIPLRIEWD